MRQGECSRIPPNLIRLQKQIKVYSSPSGKVYSVDYSPMQTVFYNTDGFPLFPSQHSVEQKSEELRHLLHHMVTCPSKKRFHTIPSETKREDVSPGEDTILSEFRLERTTHTHPRGLRPYREEQVSPLTPREKRKVTAGLRASLQPPLEQSLQNTIYRGRTIWNLRKKLYAFEQVYQEDGATMTPEAKRQALSEINHIKDLIAKMNAARLDRETHEVLSPEATKSYDLLHRRKRRAIS